MASSMTAEVIRRSLLSRLKENRWVLRSCSRRLEGQGGVRPTTTSLHPSLASASAYLAGRVHGLATATATATGGEGDMLGVSKRIRETDPPVIVATKKLIAEGGSDVLSLAQGVVYWKPPR